jgi:peroxiredoxin Q/BCP
MFHLKIGDKTPKFSVLDNKGKAFANAQLKNKKVILYFYPKDDTPGCTAQACNLRDNFNDLKSKGYEVFGISPDNTIRHEKFIEKYNLPFTLLSDENHTMAEAFGVWGEKKFMGRTYNGIHRTTFVINEKGIIENIILKVDTKNHASQI